jgi:arsenite methyltransferase
MNDDTIDTDRLRREVRDKYRDVALEPERTFDFYTGRFLAERLGYPRSIVAALPDRAVESFAGVNNPFALRPLQPGEKVLDVGSGAAWWRAVQPRLGDRPWVRAGEG